jgi:hypothetical protein
VDSCVAAKARANREQIGGRTAPSAHDCQGLRLPPNQCITLAQTVGYA